MNRPWRWLRKLTKYCFLAFLVILLLISCLLWYTTTDSFQRLVRSRLIAELEHATGGRVELGKFQVVPLRFQVEVRDLTIHGRESADQPPYVHIDSLLATVNLSSALGAKLGFHALSLSRPVIHIIFYPDGSSNQPRPKQEGTIDFTHLFSVSIDRLDVHDGELLYQDQRLPLNFNSNDISASMNYSFLHRRYSGNLAIGRAETRFDGYRPVAWSGKANFTIDRNGVEVKSLEASSERSKLQAAGTIANFQAPVFKGNYSLQLDLAQAGSVSRQPHLKAGALSMSGAGSWSQQAFSSSGKFSVRDLSWQDNTISAKNASAAGKFSFDPQKISISEVAGQFLHGSFVADAEVSNWQAQPKRTPKQRTEEQGTIKVKEKDVSLADLLASLGPQFDPVNKLKFAGSISGTTEVRWRQSIRNAEASVAADLVRPSRLVPGQIPINGSAHATYSLSSQTWNVSDLTANTPASQVRASGALSPLSSLRFSFATTDLREWEPVTRAIFPAGKQFAVRGRLAFNGAATGSLAEPVIAGNLQAQDVDVFVTRAGPLHQVHWDSLTGDIQVSSRDLSARDVVLKHDDAVVRLSGSTGLTDWKLVPASPFRFHIDLQNVNAAELANIFGFDQGASGHLAGAMDLSGTESEPRGQGSFNLLEGSIHGYAIDRASAGVTINGNQLTFQNGLIARGNARITGNGRYDRRSQNVQLELTGSNFDLAEFPQLRRSRIAVAGTLDFSAQLSGPVAMPDVSANLRLRNLTFNEELAGDYVLNTTSHGPDLRVTGHSEFKNAELSLDGNIRMQDRWPALIDLNFTRLDVDSFMQTYLHSHITGHSAVAGTLRLEGPLLDPQLMSVAGNLTDLYADVEKMKIRNDGPIRFDITNRALRVEAFHIVGDNTDFSGSGSMQFASERALDFRVNGKIGLQLLHAYNPDFTSSGTLTAEGQVTGTLDAPLVKGKIQLQDAAISDINLPSALSEINGTLLFNQNRVTIERLSAKTGGGTLTLAGHADVASRQINFDLTASANDVRLRYPPGVSSTATGNLHWTGSSGGSLLSGDITITKLGFTPGFDFGTYLERTAQVSSLPQTDPVLNKIRLDLHLVTAPDLQTRTSVMRLQGEADLHIRGNAAKPVLVGRADVFEGEAYFQGTKYRLERGGVIFGTPSVNSPTVSIPFLDLQATTHVRDYEITLSLTGPANRPKMNYRSDPPLPPADIISLLAFGGTSEQSAQLQQSSQSVFSQQASNAMLAAALNATLNNRTQRLFGTNSRIKIDPQGLATETSPTQSGPAVTIEQQVKDNLTLTYTTEVSQTSQQIIRAEYNVTRNISIVAIRDQNGVVSFDVKIRHRHR